MFNKLGEAMIVYAEAAARVSKPALLIAAIFSRALAFPFVSRLHSQTNVCIQWNYPFSSQTQGQ